MRSRPGRNEELGHGVSTVLASATAGGAAGTTRGGDDGRQAAPPS